MKRLEQLVEEKYSDLNENDLYIWQYIYHHRKECQKLSIQQLAVNCNVSHTSIIRFAKKLGLEGFSELKIYIKWSLDHFEHYDQHIVLQTTNELEKTIQSFGNYNLEPILEAIYHSEKIFIYGTGDVQTNCAREIRRQFLSVKKLVHVINGMSELEVVLRNISKNDIFILLSYSGDNMEIVMLSKALKQMKVTTLAIAQDNKNLLSRYSTHFIGFQSTNFATGISDLGYTTVTQYFIISSLLTVNYIDFINNKMSK